MNLALGALIILILLLPSLFFRLGLAIPRKRFKRFPSPKILATLEDEKKQHELFSNDLIRSNFINVLSRLNFSETIFFFSVIPIVLHLFSLWVLYLLNYQIDFSLLLNIFPVKKMPLLHLKILYCVIKLISFLKYCLLEIVTGFILGWVFAHFIIGSKDILRLLVGDNIWYQLFRGLMLKDEQRDLVDVILVDILSNTKETTILYSGLLVKFYLVPNARELAYITIRSASRRDLRSGSSKLLNAETGQVSNFFINENGTFVQIPGKYLTLLGKEILNINVTYLKIEKDDMGIKRFVVVPD